MKLKPLIIALSAYLALIIAHIIWGSNFVIAKLALREFPIMSLAFLRFFLASILLIPFVIMTSGSQKFNIKDLQRIVLSSILMITIHIALFYEGLSRTTAINASVLSLIAPIFSVLVGWRILKEKIYTVNLFGTSLALFGALTVLGLPFLLTGVLSQTYITGDVLIILSSLIFVLGAMISKPMLLKYHSLTITFFMFLIGSITFAIPAGLEFIQDPTWISKVTILGVLGLLFITILSTITAFFLFEWGIEKLGLAKAQVFQYIQPAFAATIAVPLLQERISFSFVVGTVLIILGVYWGTLGKEEHHHKKWSGTRH